MSNRTLPSRTTVMALAIAAATALAMLALSPGARAASTTEAAPTVKPLKAAACSAVGSGPKQCSAGEKCMDGRCVPDPKGPKTGPVQKR